MTAVLPPDIRERDPQPGAPLAGPKNRVNELEVVPFDAFGDEVAAWRSDGAIVLSLWTEDERGSPVRYCLSREGGKMLLAKLREALEV